MRNRPHPKFESWYREYFQGAYRYAYRLIGNSEDAKQIAQETFVNIYSRLSADDGVDNPKALVFRIATNIALNFLKREKKWGELLIRHAVAPDSSGPTPDEKMIREARIALIKRSLLSLPPRDRRCLLLYQEGFSYTEIAQTAGLKKSSVGKILARAIARLAREIANGEKP